MNETKILGSPWRITAWLSQEPLMPIHLCALLDSLRGQMCRKDYRCEVSTLKFVTHLTLSWVTWWWHCSRQHGWSCLKGMHVAEENITVSHNDFVQWGALKLGCSEWDPGGICPRSAESQHFHWSLQRGNSCMNSGVAQVGLRAWAVKVLRWN